MPEEEHIWGWGANEFRWGAIDFEGLEGHAGGYHQLPAHNHPGFALCRPNPAFFVEAMFLILGDELC